MRSINSKQYKSQLRAHYNHVSKCDDHHKQSNNISQSEPGNCSCPNYSEQINTINTNITNINNEITDIKNYLSQIFEYIQNNQPSQGTSSGEQVTLSFSTPSAGTTRSIDSPNTVAFDSLLADVEEMDSKDMDEFYNQYISPVIAQNGYNLLAPIPVSALCSCTKVPSSTEESKWEDLNGDEYIENKRAYIMQFILANRSNSTRAMYLTNQLIGAFALPL